MDKVNVVWASYHENAINRGYWDNGMLEDLMKRGNFRHHNGFDTLKANAEGIAEGAVVVINGRMHFEDVDKINEDIAKLRWCVLIITGDEEGQFPQEQIRHPLLRIWMMLPRMNKHNDVSFRMPNGYRPETHATLKKVGYQEKVNDFIFVGQLNHARRWQCYEAANALPPEFTRVLIGTEGFGADTVAYPDYMKMMAQSKIALCPSGVETPDSFRLYEALEAGCLPVVDAFATNTPHWGFWQYLFGDDLPFPVIPYWSELPNLLPELLRNYPENAQKAFAWWQKYKRDMYLKLIDDIKEVSR